MEVINATNTKLINISLRESRVPQIWKQANVVPVYKKGDKHNFTNYRPISLLSCTGKVMERVVFKYVFNYVCDHDILSKFQSGFTPGDGSVNQLAQLYHLFCEALDKKKDVRAVFCDISKAFDRVWHDGLLFKLNQIGIHGGLLNWFQNYLDCRKQRVTLKGKHSEWGNITAGVPQGSVLGPLLFLIYINDITERISGNIRLFADDTTLFINVDDLDHDTATINADLAILSDWAQKWLVSFNESKTMAMFISNKRNTNPPDLIFNNVILDTIQQYTHLGLTINSNLTWSSHIQNICAKARMRTDL
jgi:hypothetical protein